MPMLLDETVGRTATQSVGRPPAAGGPNALLCAPAREPGRIAHAARNAAGLLGDIVHAEQADPPASWAIG
jgi:hypothetical protein